MKSALTVVLFRLFTIGVFVDGKEASNVSVMEGDTVTLKSGVTGVQTVDDIEWRFKGNRIDKFVDGLQQDSQTGDLKISNIRTKDSGLYKVKISSTSTSGSSEMEFNVTVVSADEAKSVSVMEGDSVTLLTDPTEIQRDDEIRWRFGQQKSLVAEINRTAGIFKIYDGPDERFRDRLELNDQTGSLIITNTRTTDSGDYEADISSAKHTIHKSFNVTVSGEMTSVSVKKGESVTLQIIVTEIQSDDLIVWMFGNFNLAKFNKKEQQFYTSDVPDKRFRGRLDLDHQNGSLTIMNINPTHAGDYKLKIISSRHIINRRITVTVSGVFGDEDEVMSVMEGNRVTLNTGVTKNPGDTFRWYFEDTLIAQVNRHPNMSCLYYGKGEIFKDRLEVDYKTGSLIITTSRPEHTGRYEAEFIEGKPSKTEMIIRSSKCDHTKIYPKRNNLVIHKSFSLTVSGSGLSPGAVAGIVVAVAVAVVLLAAAVVFLVKYYHRKISEPEGQRENGVNLNTQKTDDTANEETKLPTDS